MNSLLTDSRASQLHLPDIVGQGYGTFWRFKGRYRVCKGSRASKKSKTTALWYIVNLMKYPQANLLVIRKVYRTLHDSCFTDLKWAISRLGVQAFWDVKESPLELTYKPTGQKILFRGLDDPLKVTSIAAEHGYLCWAWIEEAYEISSEADFNMIDESIRGAIPPETGLFKQVTLTFNPWNEHHWLKARFFDTPDPDTLALTTNYTCNEWLDDADRRVFERMKVQNPRRYSVAGLGEWGIVDGLVFENWVEEVFEKTIIAARPDVKSAFGLDFGYTNDPTAFFCGLVSEKEMTIWVFDELYERGLTNRTIYQRIYGMGYAKERIRGDSAEPKSLDELREEGLRRIRPAGKGPDSIRSGIQYIASAFIDNWGIIQPLIFGIAAAMLLYNGYLLTNNALTAISNIQKGIAAVQAYKAAAANAALSASEQAAAMSTASATAAQYGFNAALLSCPLTWVIVGIIAVVAAIYLIVAAINNMTGSAISATGIICGIFAVAASLILNTGIGVYNSFLAIIGTFVNFFLGIIEWVLNAANGGFDSFGGAVANLIGQIISWFLSLGQVVTTIIDAIFGTNWTAGLEDLKGTVTQWGKNDTAITLDRGDYSGIQRIQYSDAWDAGYSFGQSVDSKVSGLFDGFSMDSMGAFDFGNTLERIEQNSGFTAANTAASSKKLDITSEELKYLRDIAEREAINRFTTAEVRIEQTNHNSISKDVDVDGIMDYWADWFAEKLDVSYEGVHLAASQSKLTVGGTVKLVILDSTLSKPSSTLVELVQTTIDPTQNAGEGLGLAPIGHVVKVYGADEEVINLDFAVYCRRGLAWEDVCDAAAGAVKDYFRELTQSWADTDGPLIVRVAQVESHLLTVPGILDVGRTALNGRESNLTLTSDHIPVLGTISAHAAAIS